MDSLGQTTNEPWSKSWVPPILGFSTEPEGGIPNHPSQNKNGLTQQSWTGPRGLDSRASMSVRFYSSQAMAENLYPVSHFNQ